MRCKIILVISLLLLTAIIVLVVISLIRSSNVTSDLDVLAEKLKPFLTGSSHIELEENLSATSQAFKRLVNDSRFNDYEPLKPSFSIVDLGGIKIKMPSL
jgi:hypothetical protein